MLAQSSTFIHKENQEVEDANLEEVDPDHAAEEEAQEVWVDQDHHNVKLFLSQSQFQFLEDHFPQEGQCLHWEGQCLQEDQCPQEDPCLQDLSWLPLKIWESQALWEWALDNLDSKIWLLLVNWTTEQELKSK